MKKQFLQILTSLSSLFPDKFLSTLLTVKVLWEVSILLIERMVYLHRQMENMKSLNTSAQH